jgi:hypothetical protein
MVTSGDQNARQNNNIRIGNKSSKRVGQFQVSGNNHNESKFCSGTKQEQAKAEECLLSFGALPSRLLSKNTKINIHTIILFPVTLNGCETWSLTLREECWPNQEESTGQGT